MSEDEHLDPSAEEKTEAPKHKKASSRKSSSKKTESETETDEPASDAPATSDSDTSQVVLEDLRAGTTNSDSVRHLQRELDVEVTGTFDGSTQRALRAWQNSSGFNGGRGIQVSAAQAEKLFQDGYKITQPNG